MRMDDPRKKEIESGLGTWRLEVEGGSREQKVNQTTFRHFSPTTAKLLSFSFF